MTSSQYRPSTFLLLLASIVFALGFLAAFFAHRTAEDLRFDASIINQAGLIRGSIQRATKQALHGTPSSERSAAEIAALVDRLLEQFLSEQDGCRHEDAGQQRELLNSMRAVAVEWQELKVLFARYRAEPSPELRAQLILVSERCWERADAGVLTAQHASENKLEGIRVFYVFAALYLLNIAVVVWFAYAFIRKRLEYRAAYDVTTALLNRRSFENELEREVSRSQRFRRPMALILFDIDHFKEINDAHGHHAGDKVLAAVATVAREHLRVNDSIYRIGGDEFAVIVPEAGAMEAYEVAERVRRTIEGHPFAPMPRVTISVGIAGLAAATTSAALCRCADAALYQSKQNGRNTTSLAANAEVGRP